MPKFARRHWPLLLALGVGLALRVALWGRLPRLGFVGDEAEYLASADWLALGRGFAWHTQYLWTRAPLYPLFLAAHIALFGRALEPIFVTQTALSLLNVALVYLLTLQIGGGRRAAAGIAALLAALYLPLAIYAQLLLSETLFIALLLGAFLCLGAWGGQKAKGKRQEPDGAARRWLAPSTLLLAASGVLLGLATLTRGLTLGFMPILAGWLLWMLLKHRQKGQSWRPIAAQFCLLPFAFCITLVPWSVYASRAYGGLVVVDTTGAFNLLLGARTAFDGKRDDAPTRNFVLALLPQPGRTSAERVALLAPRRAEDGSLEKNGACLYAAADPRILAALERPPEQISQAERQQLISAEAVCLLRAAPGAFVQKSLLELIDLFQINYTGDERLAREFALGRLPPWYVLALFLLDDTLYVLTLPLAVLGWAILRTHSATRPQDSALRTQDSGLRTQDSGLSTQDSGLRTQDSGLRTQDSGLSTLIGLWLLFNLAAAPLLFAINRFRVPLMPFMFVLAGYALAQLPQFGPSLRTRYGQACGALAALLLLVAATPYAYLEPRAPGAPARLASYLGPPPSSLALTRIALMTRPGYLAERALANALGAGDSAAAQAALARPELPAYSAAVGLPLLDGLEGQPGAGLDRLAQSPTRPLEQWQTAIVAGELFRQLGDLGAARRELGPELVDSQNPVAWAWEWLFPPVLSGGLLVVADDNDLGYLRGFYLGGYDAQMQRPDGSLGATTRWASGEAWLRFPGAASGGPQQLCLLASSLGWPADLPQPTVTAWIGAEALGSFTPGPALAEHCLPLPPRPASESLVIRLVAPTFVPDALDLLGQQGPQVGQLRLLAFQLDAAEVR